MFGRRQIGRWPNVTLSTHNTFEIMNLLLRLVLVTTSLVLLPRAAYAQNHGTMLWISDMHFDPFYGGELLKLVNDNGNGWRDHQEWGEIFGEMTANQRLAPAGSDANEYQVQAVLQQARRKLTTPPDLILITGDFLSHNFSSAYFNAPGLPGALATVEMHNRFVDETIAYLALSVATAFPQVPVIATLGNNDAYCGDYDIRGNSQFLANTLQTFRRYFLPSLSEDFQNTAGCYTTHIPGTQHRLMVLNSVPFMAKYPEADWIAGFKPLSDSCTALRTVEPGDIFDWMTTVTEGADHHQRIWVVCHVPPGVACYDGTQNWSHPVAGKDKTVPIVNLFQDYFLQHQTQLAGVLSAHSHAAEFKLIRDTTGTGKPVSFVLMAPSIGRNHSNNASFRLMTFERASLRVLDYETHWMDGTASNPVWGQPFRFTETYRVPDVSTTSLAAVYEAMKSSTKLPDGKTYLDQYFFDYSTRNNSQNSQARSHYVNAVGNILGP